MAHCFVSNDPGIIKNHYFQSVYEWGKVGLLGLEYFFVLSSFLISIIILEERTQTADFNMINFIARRALRVWPLYFLIVVIGYAVFYTAILTGTEISPLPPFPFLFLFLVNFYIISHGSEFLFFIAFLWSISVEEQFYLLWSFCMKYIHRYFSHFCVFLILISLIFRYLYIDNSASLFFHTVSAFGNFGIGGLLAYFMFTKKKIVFKMAGFSGKIVGLIYVALILLIAFYHQLMRDEIFRLFSRLIYSLFFAYVILDQSSGKHRIFSFGKLPFLDYLGKISYGLYCFHGVVITLLLQVMPFLFPTQSLIHIFLIFPLIIFLITVLLSHISYRYFEEYFLGLKNKFYSFKP